MKQKYVIIDDCFPIIFSNAHKHSDFRSVKGKVATSAGFFQIDFENKTVVVFGESTSLKLKPQLTDVTDLNRLIFGEER